MNTKEKIIMNDINIQQTYNISTFKNLKLNYWGIRKCGHTSVKYILLQAEKPNIFRKHHKNAHGNPHEGWVHQACTYITPKQARQNTFKNFTVLRDPISRVQSMFNNLLKRPGKASASGSAQFKNDIHLLVNSPNLNILSFLNLLEQYPDKDRNIHYRSQKSHCLFDDIIKINLSNISSTIQQIHPSLKANVQLNASEKKPTLPEHVIERIHEVFYEDFQLLEECKK